MQGGWAALEDGKCQPPLTDKVQPTKNLALGFKFSDTEFLTSNL